MTVGWGRFDYTGLALIDCGGRGRPAVICGSAVNRNCIIVAAAIIAAAALQCGGRAGRDRRAQPC